MSRRKTTWKEIWDHRRLERKTFLWCFLVMAAGFLLLFGSGFQEGAVITPRDCYPMAVYGASLLLIHLTLVAFKSEADPLILGTVVFLAGFGILAQCRMHALDMDSPLRPSHFAYPAAIVLVLAVWAVCRQGRHRVLERLALPSAALSLALLAALLILGQRYRGAIYAPGKMTPTEILKVLVVIFLAGQLAAQSKALRFKDGKGPWLAVRPLLVPGIFWVLLSGLLLIQRDLGLLVILSLVLVVMLYTATGHLRYVAYAGVLAALAGVVVFVFLPHGQQRFAAWLDPFQDPTGSGWQILQGLSGMYAGGLWGAGFGMGDPERIPIAKSDFIYAVIGEEMGFVGCLLVAMFYLLFASRGLWIARQQPHPFPALLVTGLTTMIVGQAFLNMAGVVKFLPLTGITLPFVSHGGSSLVTGFIGLGILLAISDSPAKKPRPAKRRRQADTE